MNKFKIIISEGPDRKRNLSKPEKLGFQALKQTKNSTSESFTASTETDGFLFSRHPVGAHVSAKVSGQATRDVSCS